MLYKFLPGFILLAVLGFAGRAQSVEVSGKVTDADTGEPLPGVNIVVKNTSHGTVTTVEGNYVIEASTDAILVFSSVGYEPQEITINSRSTLDVELETDVKQLEELVVVGYGTMKREDVTGSVSSIASEKLTKIPTPNFDQALQGMAAGVQVSSSSGVPGSSVSIKVRGINSINADTDPLWIIDGMPIYSGGGLERANGTSSQNPMSLINANDIASIEVLKDAAATAIYGSRGSSGVIIITTKSGKKGQGSVNIDYNSGIQNLVREPSDLGFVNTSQYFELADLAMRNSTGNTEARFTPSQVLSTRVTLANMSRNEAELIDTDWYQEAIRPGSYHDLNLSSSLGLDKGSIYLSANYRQDNSVNRNNKLQRISGRMNLSYQPINNLAVEGRFNLSYTQNDRIKSGASGAVGTGGGRVGGFGVINRTALTWFPIYDSNHPLGYWSPSSGANIRANLDQDLLKDEVQNYRTLGGVALEYFIPQVKGLSIRSEASFDVIQNNGEEWVNQYMREDTTSYAFDRSVTYQSINYNLYAKYNQTFNDVHRFNLVFGTESQEQRRHTRDMEGQDLVGSYQELGNPATRLTMTSRLGNERYIRAIFGRLNYSFNDKYLLGISLRRDGSSKFGSNYRWGTFSAFSFGWLLSEEEFMQPLEIFSLLKLRGSFGQTGNESIPNNRDIDVYTNNSDDRYGPFSLISAGTRVTNIGNEAITWETTNSYDIGIDFGLLDNRINGSVAYYIQDVQDMILEATVPPSTGLSGSNTYWDNIGDMRNQGFELEVQSTNIHKNDFRWETTLNFSTNQNKVLSLTPDLDQAGVGLLEGNRNWRTGGRLGVYFMADYAGVDPERGVEMIHEVDREHYLATGETLKTGRLIPATNTNVQLNRFRHEDKTQNPTYFGGFNNSLSYKGFTLDVFFTYSGGNYIYDYNRNRVSYFHNGQNVILQEVLYDNWKAPGDQVAHPRVVFNSADRWGWDPEANDGAGDWVEGTGAGNYSPEQRIFSRWLYRGDYIRLRNVQLGYNLPAAVLDRLAFTSARVYISGTNLLTFTDYPGYDPEGVNFINTVPLPNLKTFSLGISLKL
ncbi:MAG: SusC/RagA family TonB-linked outer membrane protein [Candidatus Cyclobacteriaceae bacterium M3_2C_046]